MGKEVAGSSPAAACRTRRHRRAAAQVPQANAYAMICRRAVTVSIETKIGNHTFRAMGITAYLKNGGTLEKAAAIGEAVLRFARRSSMTAGATT